MTPSCQGEAGRVEHLGAGKHIAGLQYIVTVRRTVSGTA